MAAALTAKHEELLAKAEAVAAVNRQLSTPTRPKPEFQEDNQLGEERGTLNRSTAERLTVSLNKVGCRNFPR